MIVFVTGNDTGVGKTVLTAAWIRHLRALGKHAVGLKPLASGGRSDARLLWHAAGRTLSLDEVNPWWFRAPIAPAAAARRTGVDLNLSAVVGHVKRIAVRCDLVIVEGAGGLLSPLGPGFDNRDLLIALDAMPVVVVPNRLGAVNQARLVHEALSRPGIPPAHWVFMNPARLHPATRTHAELLAPYLPAEQTYLFPWLGDFPGVLNRSLPRKAETILERLTRSLETQLGRPPDSGKKGR
ncbi:MAG: hypothetical protein KatS3mg132_620 [Limisphaera sp.]|nr:MAG: hypothetical protein KatS3mg132_620 [Limisphaera sp.]